MASPLPRGRIKSRPEDFVVSEIAAYEPSGAGDHVFVRLTKVQRTTLDVVSDLARALGCDSREAGYAGMKDKRAVATQTISLHVPRGAQAADLVARARAVAIDGVTILDAAAHGNKLKPGHLDGNAFDIVIRGLAVESAEPVFRELARIRGEGVPNAFGAQRFGSRRDGRDNVARARAWLQGREAGPRDRRVQRLLWSSLQSAVFNAVLAARVTDGTWATPLSGDLLKLRTTGGLFVCADPQGDRERAITGEVSPTGPIVGARMRWPSGVPEDLERSIAGPLLEGIDLARTRALGEGSRRALRIWVEDLGWELLPANPEDRGNGTASVRVHFVLPKGGYATTVLAGAVALDEPEGESRDDGQHDETPSD
jgi:tRNA pseudouridine13 synthase